MQGPPLVYSALGLSRAPAAHLRCLRAWQCPRRFPASGVARCVVRPATPSLGGTLVALYALIPDSDSFLECLPVSGRHQLTTAWNTLPPPKRQSLC